MKKIILFAAILLINFTALAQKDKVYLKNGSLIRGTIEKGAVLDSLKINISNNSIYIPLQIVDEIRFAKRKEGRPDKYNDLSYRQGMATAFKAGFLLGNHSYNNPLKAWVTLEVGQEYHYHPLLNGGIGIGVNFYDYYTVFPFYFEYQAFLGKRHKSLFVYGRAGHSFIKNNVDDDHEVKDEKGGLMLASGIGLQKRVGQNDWRFKLGYVSQTVTEESEPVWIWGWPNSSSGEYFTTKRHMNRISFSFEYVLNYR